MTIKQQAATALAHAAGVAMPEVDTAHLRRLRTALAREVTVMLGVPRPTWSSPTTPARWLRVTAEPPWLRCPCWSGAAVIEGTGHCHEVGAAGGRGLCHEALNVLLHRSRGDVEVSRDLPV